MKYAGYAVRVWLLAIVLLFTQTKCNKNEQSTNIPRVRVNLRINVNNPANFDLQATGGWEYYAGGSRGILIYRQGPNEFNAYDRHSPYKPDDGCQVFVDSTNVAVEDPCSGSRFSIYDGSVQKGPATQPLKQYKTNFDGTYLDVYN